ncbi:hypothetical protein FKM82_024906 [Ascaphus truei]
MRISRLWGLRYNKSTLIEFLLATNTSSYAPVCSPSWHARRVSGSLPLAAALCTSRCGCSCAAAALPATFMYRLLMVLLYAHPPAAQRPGNRSHRRRRPPRRSYPPAWSPTQR